MKNYIVLGFLLISTTVNAVKMQPGVVKITQKDGTTISVKAYGDADLSYYVASDGTLLYLEGKDFFVAQVNNDGTLSATTVLAHDPALRSEIGRASCRERVYVLV